MPRIIRSALFKRQLLDITSSYRERAGSPVALKFVDQIEDSIAFIAAKPLACAVYTRLEGNEFRKWGVKNFPVSLFFRLEGDETIVLEALYAHRMNIAGRFPKDIE
ncbi:type II toxin-antitoxin system RelE/ParE family toxin [Sedimentitalea sp. HM32M-2]|uniref:type II toxin-antitoxin system RelE/ParE family toxin n=1 Tax=Sedimentitalea sp. HM32M-2 TaxID=3351566 RepID=UPI00362992BA